MNKRILLIFLLGCCLFCGTLQAQKKALIEVDSMDTPLIITGIIEGTNSLTGNLRLTVRGGDLSTFTFLPSDLKRENSDDKVSRQNVNLVGDRKLDADVPKDFQVSVSGLSEPGVYKGQVEILQQKQPRGEALTIDIIVKAKMLPALTLLPGTDQVRLSLVNCNSCLDCSLARWLLPASAFLNSYSLKFENTVMAPVKVLGFELVIRGENSGYQLANSQLVLPQDPQILPAQQIGTLKMDMDRSQMPPDHYTGTIYMKVEDKDELLKIPVDMNVRKGPFWVLVFLLAGIVLGRLVKYMQERGKPQSEALTAVYEVEGLIQEAHPDDRKMLEPFIQQLRQLVYQEKLEKFNERLEAFRGRIEQFQKLRSITELLAGKEQHPKVVEALDKIAKARYFLAQEEDDKAKILLEELRNDLASLSTTLMGAERKPDPDVKKATLQAEKAIKAAEQTAAEQLVKFKLWRKVRKTLIFLSGLSDEIRAEATLWLVRPLLYFALIVGLLAVGIGSLYIDNGATFGAKPFSDYLGLLIWGLSADVAGRTLSNLKSN